MFKKLRLVLVNAILPNGFYVVRDYSKTIQYITLEANEYECLN
jgi:hypothetical protein